MKRLLNFAFMSSKALRWFVILSALVLLGLGAVQVAWFRQAYRLEDRDFDQRVHAALRTASQRLIQFNANSNRLMMQPIRRVTSNYYTVQINDVINPTVLEAFLRQEFACNDLQANFEYGVYDCIQNRIQYVGFVCTTGNCDNASLGSYRFPQVASSNYYFSVYFPQKGGYLFGQLSWLMLSTAALALVTIFFVYALWVIFKQKRLSELQTDFVNTLTHEFKTPLTTILISSEVLARADSPDEPDAVRRRQSYAALLRNEANRLKNQVDAVLQTARLPRSAEGLKVESIDVHELLRELMHSWQPSLQQSQGHLSLDFGTDNVTLQGDVMHLTNVFNNLIDNAIKYSERPPDVKISTDYKGNALRIRVADNGIGIAEKARKLIFDKFYRVPTGNVHNVKGFGLGLYYVRTLVEAHGGRVSVESSPGVGTVFEVALPL